MAYKKFVYERSDKLCLTPTRRRFLSCTLAGGVGAAIASTGAQTVSGRERKPPVTSPCKASAADAMFLYMDVLNEVNSAALREAGAELSQASGELSKAFSEVRELAQQLEEEINKTQSGAQAQQIRGLSELGNFSARSIANVSAASPECEELVNNLARINEEVNRTAQTFLPEEDSKISSTARRLINKILAKVKSTRIVQARLDVARCNYKKKEAEIDAGKAAIRQAFGEAIQAILEFEEAQALYESLDANDPARPNALVLAKQAQTTSAQKVEDAKKALEKKQGVSVTQNQPTQDSRISKTPFEIIIFLLDGVKQWINQFSGLSPLSIQTGDGVTFMPAAHHTNMMLADDLDKNIKEKLQNFCRSFGTDGQIKICKDTVLGLKGRWANVVPKERQSIIFIILWGKCSAWFSMCEDRSLSLWDIAGALASLKAV